MEFVILNTTVSLQRMGPPTPPPPAQPNYCWRMSLVPKSWSWQARSKGSQETLLTDLPALLEWTQHWKCCRMQELKSNLISSEEQWQALPSQSEHRKTPNPTWQKAGDVIPLSWSGHFQTAGEMVSEGISWLMAVQALHAVPTRYKSLPTWITGASPAPYTENQSARLQKLSQDKKGFIYHFPIRCLSPGNIQELYCFQKSACIHSTMTA